MGRSLRYVLEILGASTYPSGIFFPQGFWSDHHAAIHTDCDWDWAGAMEAEAARDKAYLDEARQEQPPLIERPKAASGNPLDEARKHSSA